MTNLEISLSAKISQSYNIVFENGALNNFFSYLPSRFEKTKTFAIITDTNVAPLYEKTVVQSLVASGFSVISYSVPAGEKSKSSSQFFTLQNWLAENQITRSDAIIALGGGVVGDLAGFVAATYLRGVPFLQVPTTLLAMVDSSVGGKTAVDIPAGKNLVGAFYQPAAVFVDPTVLSTLPADVFSDGMAEVIKHAMIRGENLLPLLEAEPQNLTDIIIENVKIKRAVVERDEFDTGERQLLNFGHTIAHALEELTDFELSHGKAVVTGMAIMTRAAVKKSACPPECLQILNALLQKHNLPTHTDFTPQEIFRAALTDKKRTGDTITEVIPCGAGVCELQKMPVAELLEWISGGL